MCKGTVSCFGCSQMDVMLEADVTASSNDLLYEWTGNGFTSNETMPLVNHAGMYDLTVTNDENGCSATASTEVTQGTSLDNVFFTAVPPSCFGRADGLLQIDSVANGSPPYTYTVGNVATTDPLIPDLAAGSYDVLVMDNAGCEMTFSFTLDEPPLIEIFLSDDIEINAGEMVQLSPIITAPADIFVWTNEGSLSCGDCPDPIAQPTETTLYTLSSSTDTGSEAMDDILISVINSTNADVYVPNIFSPNGDGVNEVFSLFSGEQITNVKTMLLFDRWGDFVYQGTNLSLNDPSQGWDGYYKGKPMDTGVYVFYAEVELVDGSVKEMEGEVVLIR